jgi:hypothetical protein
MAFGCNAGSVNRRDLTIRRSQPGDALALGRLARLDDTLYDGESCLLAEAGGELWAALPLHGGPGFADPFRPSGEALELLELRRAQLLVAVGGETGVSRARRAARRLRRYRGPASA